MDDDVGVAVEEKDPAGLLVYKFVLLYRTCPSWHAKVQKGVIGPPRTWNRETTKKWDVVTGRQSLD